MARRVRTDQVRLGMFIQSLEGSWFAHPFWKGSFLLERPDDLRALRDSGVQWVWIDAARGVDISAAEVPSERSTPVAGPQTVPPPVREAPKPPRDPDEFRESFGILNRSRQVIRDIFREARMGQAIDLDHCLPLVEDICASLERDAAALISLARLKHQDEYTYMHSVAVCALMVSLSRQVGLDLASQRDAGLAGLLHDIGKVAMPPALLNKPGRLSEGEFALMRSHPERGHEMLLKTLDLSPRVLDVCLHHHERYDGTGYPHRLAGERIGLFARMGAICDVYDAVTSERPYKSAWEAPEALARMARWEGHFDPLLFQAFVKAVGIYPLGSLVRLASGRVGVVVRQNPGNLTRPQVRVFFCARRRQALPPQLLDLARADDQERIVERESAARWGFRNLERLWLPDGLPPPG